MKKTLLVVGHGSREAKANEGFEAFVGHFQKYVPGTKVRFGYVELASPSLVEALESSAAESDVVTILPLFLFSAGHVKNDLPLAIHAVQKKFPNVHFHTAPSLGVNPLMLRLLSKRTEESAAKITKPKGKTILIVMGRGASDPDANGDFCKLVRLLEESSEFARVETAYCGIVNPRLDEVLNRVALERPEAILIQPYLLFPGKLIQKIEEQVVEFSKNYPWIQTKIGECLGEDESVFELLKERGNSAESGQDPLPCTNCQYRVPLEGFEDQVGGLKSLLWSVRHSFTHTQAMPHTHSHKPVRKHVLVCGNVDCVDQGSIATLETLKRLVKKEGMEKEIKITKTSCLGLCGDGPTVAVYPDGIWYRRCEEKHAQALLKNHLMNDELVTEIVDHIIQ